MGVKDEQCLHELTLLEYVGMIGEKGDQNTDRLVFSTPIENDIAVLLTKQATAEVPGHIGQYSLLAMHGLAIYLGMVLLH